MQSASQWHAKYLKIMFEGNACCLLLAACCLLLAACCLLPAACCLLLAACCLLRAACLMPQVHVYENAKIATGVMHLFCLMHKLGSTVFIKSATLVGHSINFLMVNLRSFFELLV
jgi:hypothetical protein